MTNPESCSNLITTIQASSSRLGRRPCASRTKLMDGLFGGVGIEIDDLKGGPAPDPNYQCCKLCPPL